MTETISENNKRIAKNTLYMYMRMLIVVLVSLYTTRIVLKTLGIDDYGIYNVVGGIVVLFSFINQGLAGAAKRFIMAELTVGNLESQRKIYSTAINAHVLVAVIIFILGETVGLWILYHLMNIPADRMQAAAVVYQMSLFTAILTILQSPFNSVVISHERMSVYALISIIDVFLKLGIVFVVRAANYDKLITYAILLFLISILNIIVYFSYCRKKFEMCRYVKTKDNSSFKSLMTYVGWTVFGTGANVLSRQGVSILVNNFYSVAVNSAIGISNAIAGTAMQFVNSFQIAFGPQITKNYIAGNYYELNNLVIRTSRYSSLLVLIILIPASFVISDLLFLWLGEYPKYTEEFCIITLVCIFFESISNPLVGVITSDKRIGKYQTIVSVVYLFNVLFCWIALLLGALPFFVLFVRLFFDFALITLRLNLIKKKVLSFPILLWMRKVVFNSFLIVIGCVPLFFLIKPVDTLSVIVRFILQGSICVIWVALLVWFLGLTHNEKTFALKRFRNLLKR